MTGWPILDSQQITAALLVAEDNFQIGQTFGRLNDVLIEVIRFTIADDGSVGRSKGRRDVRRSWVLVLHLGVRLLL